MESQMTACTATLSRTAPTTPGHPGFNSRVPASVHGLRIQYHASNSPVSVGLNKSGGLALLLFQRSTINFVLEI